MLRITRNRLGMAGARRIVTEHRHWPVPAAAARLPVVDDMLAPRPVWQRGDRMTLTGAFGAAVAAYVVCAVIVFGFASGHLRSDQVATAVDAHAGQLNAPRRNANGIQRVAPGLSGNEKPLFAPSAEAIDAEFFTRLQSVVNGIEGQPGQPRPYQPDPIQPVIEPGSAAVLGPLAPVPPAVIAPPVVGPGGQIAEPPPLEVPVPSIPAAVPQTPAVAPSSPAVVTSSAQAPESAVQPPLEPPPGPAA
ncbi:hypothetical protein MANY_39220 [Mycolicibacterium anyangense]|uniref:Uncharacterized protein n=1 Tax=Mycolicibacterium anyangense TaxID=1431246 RepID=A0A6N4WCU2_9MYCO|nr:hypothetical protein MANY_39220 [Mycolicibacterium anyangense]